MIRHQQRIVVLYERTQLVRQLGGAWRSVLSQRNATKIEYNLRNQRLVERNSCCRICCGARRVCMHDGLSVRPHLVYEKMHRHFARRLALAFDALSLEIDDDHVLGLYESLVADRRRAHDMTIGK